jgi:hypothetical protein
MKGRLETKELSMRKILILTVTFIGIAGVVAAAQASQDRAPEKDSSQVTTQTESSHKDGEQVRAPRGERSQQGRERYREERSEADEHEDEDRD